MSYIIKFKDNKFIISGNNKILLVDYDKYFEVIKKFLKSYDYIEITMEKNLKYFFLTTKFGLKLYEHTYFSNIINTNEIFLFNLAKNIYVFYINKLLY